MAGPVVQLPNNDDNDGKKFCVVCNQEMYKHNDYFCSIACYTRFRIGIDVDYEKIKLACKYPRPPRISKGFIDYSKYYYCRSCQLKVPQSECNELRCPHCNRLIHTRKRNKLRNIKTEDNRIRISAD